MNLFIFDPSEKDDLSAFRGGGRILQILRENLPEARFINDLSHVNFQDSLFIPSWQPFQLPELGRRIARKQILMIFDVIPLKFLHHFPIGIRGNFNLWKNKRALKNFDKIITISQHSKKDIVQYLHIPEEKIEVVYPTINKIFLNPETSTMLHATRYALHNERFALYVGDVNWNKNLLNLARAIKISNVNCIFVGKPFVTQAMGDATAGRAKRGEEQDPSPIDFSHPWQQEFRDFLQEVGDDKRFIFSGYVPDEQLKTLYKNAVCNILVSRDEGFGISFLEAATQECPSVLADVVIFHEIANESALFASPEDPDDIAAKITGLFSYKETRDELGKKAHAHSQKFSPEDFKKNLLHALSE